MLKHIVMLRLREMAEGEGKVENARKVKELLEGLKDKIEEIISLEVGINIVNNGQGADLVLCTEFESVEALNRCVVHPENVEVFSFIKKVIKDKECRGLEFASFWYDQE